MSAANRRLRVRPLRARHSRIYSRQPGQTRHSQGITRSSGRGPRPQSSGHTNRDRAVTNRCGSLTRRVTRQDALAASRPPRSTGPPDHCPPRHGHVREASPASCAPSWSTGSATDNAWQVPASCASTSATPRVQTARTSTIAAALPGRFRFTAAILASTARICRDEESVPRLAVAQSWPLSARPPDPPGSPTSGIMSTTDGQATSWLPKPTGSAWPAPPASAPTAPTTTTSTQPAPMPVRRPS